jgi:hypothetical protein
MVAGLRQMKPLNSRNKYGAVKTTLHGITFDSKAEAAFYGYLLPLQKIGRIEKIELQHVYVLHAGIKYVADFVITMPGGLLRYIDVKGYLTPEFKLKRKLFEKDVGPLEVVKASYRGGTICFDWS